MRILTQIEQELLQRIPPHALHEAAVPFRGPDEYWAALKFEERGWGKVTKYSPWGEDFGTLGRPRTYRPKGEITLYPGVIRDDARR